MFCLCLHWFCERQLYKECGAGTVKRGIAFCHGSQFSPVDPLQFSCSRLRFPSGLERIDILAEHFNLSKAIGLRGAARKRQEQHSENNCPHRLFSQFFADYWLDVLND
jgi:hypothetical protein